MMVVIGVMGIYKKDISKFINKDYKFIIMDLYESDLEIQLDRIALIKENKNSNILLCNVKTKEQIHCLKFFFCSDIINLNDES